MKRCIPLFVVVAWALSTALAHAEYRTVLIRLQREKDQTTVSIYSDEKKEQKSAISPDDAAKIIRKMRGWGSSVGVYVTGEGSIAGPDLKKVLLPICENFWLDLISYGSDSSLPSNVKEHFLGKR